MKYAEMLAADQRLCLLTALAEAAGYALNEHVLKRALEAVGHALSTDSLRVHLAWLAEQGLTRVEHVDGLQIARLTPRGEDAAAGRAAVPGVARPRPEA
jgi:repressor of nif and glnA expression